MGHMVIARLVFQPIFPLSLYVYEDDILLSVIKNRYCGHGTAPPVRLYLLFCFVSFQLPYFFGSPDLNLD
jgi:hypothetical protein